MAFLMKATFYKRKQQCWLSQGVQEMNVPCDRTPKSKQGLGNAAPPLPSGGLARMLLVYGQIYNATISVITV